MRIVLPVHQFLPDFSTGTEILTFEVARELNNRGHDVEIWAGFPASEVKARDTAFDSYEYQNIQVNRYNHNYSVFANKAMEMEFNNPFFAERFREYILDFKPDIVHFFHFMRLSASPVEVCWKQNLPSVFTPTDFWIICPTCQLRLHDNTLCEGPDHNSLNCLRHLVSLSFGEPFWNIVHKIPLWFFVLMVKCAGNSLWPERRFSPLMKSLVGRKSFLIEMMNKLDRVLVPTRFMESVLVKNGLNFNISKFIPYGLNLKPFEKGCEKKPGSGRLRVGFIGTLLEHKGAHILLEAIANLPKDTPVDLKIYGKLDDDKNYAEKLTKLADGDQRIQFCGNFPNSRIAEVFSELDVLVVPSIWYENTPLVIYSAFASGTPVIATNLGGMSEVVHHEVNGLLFEKGDAKGLSLLLNRLVEDKTLLERLAKNVTPPPSISDYVDGLESVYKDVLAKRRKK